MFDKLRLRLAGVNTGLSLLALLGIVCGLVSGGVIVLFRLMLESLQATYLPGGGTENFEQLPPWAWFALPAAGGLLLGLIFQWLDPKVRSVGVVHTMERLAYHQGRMPLKNALVQYFGAIISIASGHSVGREGPSVHLGAASGGILGSLLTLPNNSIRNLVACGVAAAIAASFNTPIAGVIFAMEVVLMEYSIAGFIPVMLAAVSATSLSQLVFGDESAFIVPPLGLVSTTELPWVLLSGLAIGLLAVLFIQTMKTVTLKTAKLPMWLRLTLAGVITGLAAMAFPQIMGIGYDSVSSALSGEMILELLVALVFAKLLITTVGLGLGLPGGLIGPTLFIGAMAGGALGIIGHTLFPEYSASPGFYAMLGMAAMMAATLQAPLAALMALMELTSNPNIILPGMLIVVSACLLASEGFRQSSVFITLLKARGLDYASSPLAQALRRVGVTAAMDTAFAILPQHIERERALRQLQHYEPRWLLIESEENEILALMPAAALLRGINETDAEQLDLMELPARRLNVTAIGFQSTLQEALEIMGEQQAEALYIERSLPTGERLIYGILSREDIDAFRVKA